MRSRHLLSALSLIPELVTLVRLARRVTGARGSVKKSNAQWEKKMINEFLDRQEVHEEEGTAR